MSRVRIDRRVYLNEDRSRAVPEGDSEARFLLCVAGGEVSRADAERYGLLDQPEPESVPEPEPEPDETGLTESKARRAPANKARGRAADK